MEKVSGVPQDKTLESVYVALTVALPELLSEIGLEEVSERLRVFKMGEWNRAKINLREMRYELAKTYPDLYPFLANAFSECYSAVWAACAVQGHAAFGKKAALAHAERVLEIVGNSIREYRQRDEPRPQAPA